eukprot:TRINITY_DN8097_c0_g2_i1.p1 TRINITY_DN8097_c0_g2~~TRINITY_DN8097_c0_g2_i1.p1  ORF type:complete len:254 (+),score=43.63 TRINITY_DN8097_c0_g2_i1:38-763(+)
MSEVEKKDKKKDQKDKKNKDKTDPAFDADALPSPEVVADALQYEVIASDDSKHALSSLITSTKRTCIIFIRHFFCGLCQDYITNICKITSPEELAANESSLVFIGCGDPSLISFYVKETGCTFPLYADPSGGLYDKLGMIRGLNWNEKPEYAETSLPANICRSMSQVVRAGFKKASKAGEINRNGGEFVFTQDGQCTWAHRMPDSIGHTLPQQIKEVMMMTTPTIAPIMTTTMEDAPSSSS